MWDKNVSRVAIIQGVLLHGHAGLAANNVSAWLNLYLTESVQKVAPQNSIPAQIRQLILDYYQHKE